MTAVNKRLTPKKLAEYREKIQRLTYYQPLIQASGYFEIHLVKQKDVIRVTDLLRQEVYVHTVHAISSGKFDFTNISPLGMPDRYFTVTGTLKSEI